jgi:D-alanyl-D-alanine carboxypeptidase
MIGPDLRWTNAVLTVLRRRPLWPAGAPGSAARKAARFGAASAIAALLAAVPAAAAPRTVSDAKALQKTLQGIIDAEVARNPQVPGVIVEVNAPREGFFWSGASGRVAIGEPARLTPAYAFRIASVTKVFVAAAIFRLVEMGELDLHAPIAGLLSPETRQILVKGGYDPERITVENLLAHTAGIHDYAKDPAYAQTVLGDPKRRWTRREQIEFAMDHGRPEGAPGQAYHYSDTHYLLLTEILDRLTGEPYPKAIRRLLRLQQLGIRSTYFETLEPVPVGAKLRAHQYLGDVDLMGVDPSIDLFGGGGEVSTVDDLAKFFRALLRGQVFTRPETLAAALTTPNVTHDPDDAPHADLLEPLVIGKDTCWGHSGYWGVGAIYCPDVDLTMAISIGQALASGTTPRIAIAVAAAVQGAPAGGGPRP